MNDERVGAAGVETVEAFAPHARPTLWELVRVFFYIGITGFGGGMAIVALVEDICVHRRRWMSADEFAHGVAFGQFLGAFAVNTTTFVGYRMLGLAGAAAAVSAFLAPGVALVIVLSALYLRYQSVPAMQAALHGIGPIVVAVLIGAAYRMGRAALVTETPPSPLPPPTAGGGGNDAAEKSRLQPSASNLQPSGFSLQASVEPALVCFASFALLFYYHVPVILIMIAVAAYGVIRHLVVGRLLRGERRP